jgi:hypothetical protein
LDFVNDSLLEPIPSLDGDTPEGENIKPTTENRTSITANGKTITQYKTLKNKEVVLLPLRKRTTAK